MNILSSKLVIPVSLKVILISLFTIPLILYFIGIENNEIVLLVANAVLLFFVTIFSIFIPINQTLIFENAKKEEELKNTYVSIAIFVGQELIENKIRIEESIRAISRSEEMLEKSPEEKRDKQFALLALWSGAAKDSVDSIENISYQGLIYSGVAAKLSDASVISAVQNAYSKISIMKQRLQRVHIFFKSIVDSNTRVSEAVLQRTLDEPVPKAIIAAKADQVGAIKAIDEAIKIINEYIDPYGRKLQIISE
jgi:hypothetical protein